MQKGKIYIKGSSWYFRYRKSVVIDGVKRWKDGYERLCSAADYSSVKSIENEFHAKIRELLSEVSSKTSHIIEQVVNDFVEQFYFPSVEKSLKPATVTGYKDFYQRDFKPFFADRRMCDIKLPIAQQWLAEIAQAKPYLSSGYFGHLKWLGVAIFNYAAQQGAFDPERKNPFENVGIPKTKHVAKPARYATLDDVVSMISVLDEPAASVVAMAAFSGLRKSEIQGLRWEDLKDNQLSVERTAWRTTTVRETTKTKASKAPVPVIPVLARYLEAHRNGFAADGFIFAGPLKKQPLDLKNLAARVIRPALKKANVPWCGWHGFRRGLATTLYELGTEARTRQAILRHANVAVTEQHYTQAVTKVSRVAMAKVEKAFNAKLKKAHTEREVEAAKR